MGKVLCFALAVYSCALFAQEVKVNPDGSVVLTLSKQEAEYCKNNGGCLVIPVNDLEPLMREAAKNMCGRKWTI
jgi:hypothetical protein